jgi:hypothetical protein
MLRDMAALLNGTKAQFSVGYDEETRTVVIVTGEGYDAAQPDDPAAGTDKSDTAVRSGQRIQVDGAEIDDMTVYNIGGNNFFKLQELGEKLGFGVAYDAETERCSSRANKHTSTIREGQAVACLSPDDRRTRHMLRKRFESLCEKSWKAILTEVEKAISGKREVIGKILMAILSDGHILLDDVPASGRRRWPWRSAGRSACAITARAVHAGRAAQRSDRLLRLHNKETGRLSISPGSSTTRTLLLGDEINRTSSRTQSALLEAMEECQVTVDGNTYPLQEPFIVIATQNNVGTAGTQTLPYAQVDRFLVRLSIGYPDEAAQMDLLRARQDADPLKSVRRASTREDVVRMQREVRAVTAKGRHPLLSDAAGHGLPQPPDDRDRDLPARRAVPRPDGQGAGLPGGARLRDLRGRTGGLLRRLRPPRAPDAAGTAVRRHDGAGALRAAADRRDPDTRG